jgi:hypothetical protein
MAAIAIGVGGVELAGTAIGNLLLGGLKAREELIGGHRINAP